MHKKRYLSAALKIIKQGRSSSEEYSLPFVEWQGCFSFQVGREWDLYRSWQHVEPLLVAFKLEVFDRNYERLIRPELHLNALFHLYLTDLAGRLFDLAAQSYGREIKVLASDHLAGIDQYCLRPIQIPVDALRLDELPRSALFTSNGRSQSPDESQ